MCRATTRCNCGKDSFGPGEDFEEASESDSDPPIEDEIFGRYWLCVYGYTQKKLTYSRDKLAALAGIAKMLSPDNAHGYINGLWRHSLLRDLHWYVTSPPERSRDPMKPSWSWISVEGIIWNRCCPIPQQGQQADSADFIAEILDISPQDAQRDPWTSITARSLKIRGYLVVIEIVQAVTDNPSDFREPKTGTTHSWRPDVSEETTSASEDPITAALLLNLVDRKYFGLVLRPVAGSVHTYRRLGCYGEYGGVRINAESEPNTLFARPILTTIELV